jgi:hypothetical protein
MFSLIGGTFEVEILLPEFLSQVFVHVCRLADVRAFEDPGVIQLIRELLVYSLLRLSVEADINKLSITFYLGQL